MKVCNRCKESKLLDKFYKDKTQKDNLCSFCKLCSKQRNKKWIKENSTKYVSYYNNNYSSNPEKFKKHHKIYYSNLKNRLNKNIRVRYIECVSKEHRVKGIQFLGCSIEDFIVYLEKHFNKDMSWKNHGTYWEIDHIHPLSKNGIFHYTNTQPLSIKENKKKYNKV